MTATREILAVDLGSTRFKAGAISNGTLSSVQAVPSLETEGTDPIYQHDGSSLLPKLQELLKSHGSYDLGLSVQRSTCLFWDRESGRPLTPLVSWRDRRARQWCQENTDLEPELWNIAGLPLSPHYAGPTIATLLNEPIRAQLRSGSALFGTVDSYAIWLLSRGRHHVSDITVASRTLLMNLKTGQWGGPLLERLDIPMDALPQIISSRCELDLGDGRRVVASMGDQAAAVVATIALDGSELLVNVGTGTFLLYPIGQSMQRVPGCLRVPVLSIDESTSYATEAPINSAVDARVVIPQEDPQPKLYCLPDDYGWGAPYWRGERSRQFSQDEESPLAVAEGVIFRTRQLIEAIAPAPSVKVVVAGGGASRSWIQGLASCLGRPVYRAQESDASLLGAGRVAEGSYLSAEHHRETLAPGETGAYLGEKYRRWSSWMAKKACSLDEGSGMK